MTEWDAGSRWRPSPLVGLSLGVHAVAVALLAAEPATWPAACGAMFLDHLVLAAVGMSPRSRFLGPNMTRLPPGIESEIALTFDDGPDPEVTPRVLDLLAEHRATATFFPIGRRADEHADLVREVVRRGHRLENHTYNHPKTFALRGPWAQGREIDRAQESLERLGGRRPIYFRAPAGIRNPWLDLVLARRGLRLASWTRRGFDTVERNPQRVTRKLLTGLAAGDVILLHDGSAARDRNGRPVVLEALPRVLDVLAQRGLRSIHLPTPTDHGG